MKIVFFGTSAVGLPIIEALRQNHEVVKIITSPDAAVGRKQIITPSAIARFAEEHDLPIEKPERVKNNPALWASLKSLQADIFIVVSYGRILPPELLDIPPLKTINIHFSLLPKYRGSSPIQCALRDGETKTGTSIFVLDELVDHGPILAQKSVDILAGDTFADLAPRLSETSAELLLEILPEYRSGSLTPKEQNHDDATFTALLKKEDGRINWTKPAQDIYNQYRAFHLWPGIWTTWQGKILKVLECRPGPGLDSALPIPCGDGTVLAVTILQAEGKTAMTAKEFMNGHPGFDPSDLN